MSEETTVILVEDDALLRDGLADFLTLSGFSVTAVGDGLSFYRVVAERPFSVAVIDLGLPDQAGEVLVDYTRRNTSSSIVVITARDTLDTRVACYRTGADLFLGKPVEGRELAAAIESLAARRAGASLPAVTGAGGAPPPAGGGEWTLLAGQRGLLDPLGTRVDLTPKEYQLLELLVSHAGGTAQRDELLEGLYGRGDGSAQRALETLVRRTRQTIAMATGGLAPILTQHSLGYAFTAPIARR